MLLLLLGFGFYLQFLGKARGHGFMLDPPSRNYQAWLQYGPEGPEFATRPELWELCPHCTLAKMDIDDMPAHGEYPGNRPFADPEATVSWTSETTPGLVFGVCGTEFNDPNNADVHGFNDYNLVPAGVAWGEYERTYVQGSEVTVEWCVDDGADHGGTFVYRYCTDPAVVASLRRAERPPDAETWAADMAAAEECFKEHVFYCDDTDQVCDIEPDCDPTWPCAGSQGKWNHCGHASEYGHSNPDKPYDCRNTDETCLNGQGRVVRKKIKIPSTMDVGPAIIHWRWDPHETLEVFTNCADVLIQPASSSGGVPTTTPAPEPTTTTTTTPVLLLLPTTTEPTSPLSLVPVPSLSPPMPSFSPPSIMPTPAPVVTTTTTLGLGEMYCSGGDDGDDLECLPAELNLACEETQSDSLRLGPNCESSIPINTACSGRAQEFVKDEDDPYCVCQPNHLGRCCQVDGRATCNYKGFLLEIGGGVCRCECDQGSPDSFCAT
ncbi:hypothetical protein CTAYLR_008751 [Chrysophaeum taylorii]|uniref:Chitin-binding type-4 domain-containing protein n=1 Tax=Chrysophaeum taylorii TaxID=2483200 RepID=A0AAD7UCQ2_9STRA|nr:hypothetical protein CTAYLR_008751 [Chrysophaeum taylorii]